MMPLVLIVMGVSGSGKTTIAEHLAKDLGWMFQEGDVLHPPANVEKMRAGTPLTDADRGPWLATIARWIDERVAKREHGIITCSALKRAYRTQLVGGHPEVRLVYLHGDRATLEQHVHARHHEFMPVALLDSQLATLEEPGPDEPVIEVDVAGSVEATVAAVQARLQALQTQA
jgi:carbohydrate kinase (thermoresistant glucokinase family)